LVELVVESAELVEFPFFAAVLSGFCAARGVPRRAYPGRARLSGERTRANLAREGPASCARVGSPVLGALCRAEFRARAVEARGRLTKNLCQPAFVTSVTTPATWACWARLGSVEGQGFSEAAVSKLFDGQGNVGTRPANSLRRDPTGLADASPRRREALARCPTRPSAPRGTRRNRRGSGGSGRAGGGALCASRCAERDRADLGLWLAATDAEAGDAARPTPGRPSLAGARNCRRP
jgi:hypothetical protein